MLKFKSIDISPYLIKETFHLNEIEWIENDEQIIDGIVTRIEDSNIKIIEKYIKRSIPIFILNFHDLNFETAQRLFKLSNEAETIIQVNSPLRFENQAKDIIDSLGSFKLISFRKSLKNKSSDYFKQLLFNEIDSFISIIKARTRKIQTFVIPENKNPIETIDCRIDLDNGIILKLLFSSNFPLEINQIELFGEKLFKVVSYENVFSEGESFNIQLEEFKNNILTNTEPKASIEDGLTSLRILNEIFTKLA